MERFLQLSVECVLDVGNHIIAGMNLRKPSTYGHILQILAEERVITKKVLNSAKPLASVRNLLVHDYEELNRETIFDTAREVTPAFEELARAYRKFL